MLHQTRFAAHSAVETSNCTPYLVTMCLVYDKMQTKFMSKFKLMFIKYIHNSVILAILSNFENNTLDCRKTHRKRNERCKNT